MSNDAAVHFVYIRLLDEMWAVMEPMLNKHAVQLGMNKT